MGFEEYLDDRLAGGERLFLLVTDLSKCSDIGRERLAGILRSLSEARGNALHTVLVGGEGLAKLKYAQGDLSLLSHAEPMNWPELNTGDLMALARQGRPSFDLALEEARAILKATGGHPRLIQNVLWCRAKGTVLETCIRELANSRQIEAQFVALTRDSRDAQQIAAWLGQDELGPYQGWTPDLLLRRLYWKNLLRAEGPTGAERLVWRCRQSSEQDGECWGLFRDAGAWEPETQEGPFVTVQPPPRHSGRECRNPGPGMAKTAGDWTLAAIRVRSCFSWFLARSHAPAWERTCGRSSGQGFMTLERKDLLPRWSVGAREESIFA